MLQDTDYRVRLFLARRISVFFHTWDGHEELFQDICIKLVMVSKEKLMTARDVLAAWIQLYSAVETSIVTLAHLAFCTEKVELEFLWNVQAIIMMCVVAAIDPCQRNITQFCLHAWQFAFTRSVTFLQAIGLYNIQ